MKRLAALRLLLPLLRPYAGRAAVAAVALLAAAPMSLKFRLLVGSRLAQAAAAALLAATFLVRDPQFREVERYTVQGLALAVLVPGLIRPMKTSDGSSNSRRTGLSAQISPGTSTASARPCR